MKKFFSFLKQHPLCALMYVVSLILFFVDEECGMTAMATATAAPALVNSATDTVPVVEHGTPKASPGIAGEPTQLNGEATTVSNVSEAGGDLIQPEIDEDIINIATDESVLDTIKRRVRRQVRVNSFEVDHYMIDEKRIRAYTSKEYTGVQASRAVLPFATVGDGKIFQEYYTAICKGVDGYDPTGQTKLPGVDLMLFFVGREPTTEAPIAMAVNGPKVNPTDDYCVVPTIPAGTEVILLSSAAYETQKFISPNTVVPVPKRVYLQKQLCNSIVSDYFKAQKKRIKFGESQIAEAIIRQFRLESARTAWIGQSGKFKVQAMDSSMGYQWDYFSEGLRWQFKRQYDLAEKITLEDLLNLLMVKFTGYNCSKRAIWLLGRELMNDIQKIDITLHKSISMGASRNETLGMDVTRLHSVFGDVDLIHDPMLDALGYTNSGALIDEDGLVRYWMKDEDSKKENVTGEEAKREIVMTIDALVLKGYSHIWVDGAGSAANGLVARISSADSLPENPSINEVVILTKDIEASSLTNNVAYSAGKALQYNGTYWKVFDNSFEV